MGWVRDRKWHGPGMGGETKGRGDSKMERDRMWVVRLDGMGW